MLRRTFQIFSQAVAESTSDKEVALLEAVPPAWLRGRALVGWSHGRLTVGLYAVLLIACAVFILLARHFNFIAWDVEATRALQGLHVPGLQGVMRQVSSFGNAPRITAVTAIALLACARGHEAVWLTWSGMGSWLIAKFLKYLIVRPRPTPDLVTVFHQWDDGSFPSGHVMFYVCYFGFLFFIARRDLPQGSLARRVALALTATPVVLVGLSRVYLGEHWASDMPGSYILGGLWLAISWKLYRGSQRAR